MHVLLLDVDSFFDHARIMKIESAFPSQFDRLVAIWESSVRATHHFLQESDIATLRPLLLNAYLPNLTVVIARDETGVIHGFLGVDENRIEMLFVDDASRGKGVGTLLLRHAIEHFGANEVDVNEQNPQGVGFYRYMGFEQVGRTERDGQGNPFPLLHMRYKG
ncbi:acetyltransferase [Leclercia sp. M-A074-M]